MITTLIIKSFKSLEDVQVDLGQINFFIGANGSGKSNLLEALGVTSAAAEGKVDDQRLLNRGVRPGVPSLYKSSFPKTASSPPHRSPHIFFAASNPRAAYEVSLHNPLSDPLPAWRYKTEWLSSNGERVAGRSPSMANKPHPEQGLAALRLVELSDKDPAAQLLRSIQEFVIYSPTTGVLRGTVPESQPKRPVGLSGGRLPEALMELLNFRTKIDHVKSVAEEALGLIDWASSYGSAPAASMPLSSAAAASPRVVRFSDRYMAKGRNILSGYDASEGALYVLFLAVLASHPATPGLFAVDNADHGLNPRLARSLFKAFCGWLLCCPMQRQAFLTTHNPLVLDGLPLQDERVRLFTVSRTNTGRTVVRRILLDEQLRKMAENGWTLSRLWVMGHLGGVPNV